MAENGEGEEEDSLGIYEGARNSNKERHGYGWALLPNGDQYDGDYRKGLRCGKGLYVFKNGARYYGDWVKGVKHGIGKFYYPDGSVYEGEWRNDMCNGHGIYIYPNKDIYEGAWYKGKRHGMGDYKYYEAKCTFRGTWKEGVRIGPAEIIHKIHRFHGFWDDQDVKDKGIYSFNCKFMVDGYISLIRDPEFDYISQNETGERNVYGKPRAFVPIWKAKTISIYDYAKLPQEPVPLPIIDSTENLCEQSLYNSEDELVEFDDNGENEENELEMNMNEGEDLIISAA